MANQRSESVKCDANILMHANDANNRLILIRNLKTAELAVFLVFLPSPDCCFLVTDYLARFPDQLRGFAFAGLFDLRRFLGHRGGFRAAGLELFYLTGGVNQVLFTGIKRMAVIADFNFHVFLR